MQSTRMFAAVALGVTMAAGLTHADAAQPRETPMPTSATVTIYTTAQDTGQRLAKTGTATLQAGHKLTLAPLAEHIHRFDAQGNALPGTRSRAA